VPKMSLEDQINQILNSALERARSYRGRKKLNRVIKEARTFLQEDNYQFALAGLEYVRDVAAKLGIELPREVPVLIEAAYQRGIDIELTQVKKDLFEGNYNSAFCALRLVEIYAENLGVEVPSDVPKLKGIALRTAISSQLRDTQLYLLEKDHSSALTALNNAKRYAQELGDEVPSDLLELEQQIHRIYRP